MTKKRVVRLVFLCVLATLAAQVVLTRLISEPYPAIAMPAFAGNGGYQGGQVVTESFDATFEFADGQTIALPRPVLLDDFPAGMHDDIAQVAFYWQAKSWFTSQPNIRRNWRYRLFPGWNAGKIDRWAERNQASLKAWLAGRAARLHPNVPLQQVRIDWYREWRGFDASGPTSRREATGSYAIQMGQSQSVPTAHADAGRAQ